jgi:chemotaxis protein CheD
VRAKLVGGACMFGALMPIAGLAMGERNVLAVREALELARVPIAAQDVGGEHGRTVLFDTRDGRVVVKSVRQGDVIL